MATEPERKQRDLNSLPCPICGQVNMYEWGYTKPIYGRKLTFVSKLGNKFGFWLGIGDKMRARKCLWCGNVQLFVEQ